MITLSDHLYIPPMGQVVEEARRTRAKRMSRYAASKVVRTNRDWTTRSDGPNSLLFRSLRTLRARARQMVRDAPHFRKFIQMAKTNVIGHQGIQLQARAQFLDGRPNTKLNHDIEHEWWLWSQPENCSLSGKLSWVTAQYLFVETLIRDGEVLIQHMPADNPWGYAIRFWNVDWLDESYNDTLPSGNRVIMSVEVDAYDTPQAYWLTTPISESRYTSRQNMRRVRVPASEMIHSFLVTEDESQVRGVTWFHASLLQGKDLHEYTSGVVQQARVAAHTLGFLKQSVTDEVEFEGETLEDGSLAPLQIDVAPLAMNELPPGYSLEQFDPKQPTQNHAAFKRAMLLDMAAGLGINGFSLSGDMGDVNYSSARVGLGEERDVWRFLQGFTAMSLCRPVYHRWLKEATLSGRLPLSGREYLELQNPYWRPRGWRYVDPHKDVAANIAALENNLATFTDVLGEQGIDLTEFLETRAAELKLAAKYGIDLHAHSHPRPPAATSDKAAGRNGNVTSVEM